MKPLEIGDLADLIPAADGGSFDTEIYRETGFFVVRNVVPQEMVASWQKSWKNFHANELSERKVNKFNPVHVLEETPDSLKNIHKCPQILDVLVQLYPNLALFMQRFVIKDKASRAPVFLHNDFCYDYGFPEKTTCFIPLSPSNSRNGGISFYPGTNHLGYMGDAGECNRELLSDDWPLICPDLHPGDIALCHTCTWHCSPQPVTGPDRIMIQATYQPSSDPSSTALLRGRWRGRYHLGNFPREEFFVRSRSSRLSELQAQLDKMTG